MLNFWIFSIILIIVIIVIIVVSNILFNEEDIATGIIGVFIFVYALASTIGIVEASSKHKQVLKEYVSTSSIVSLQDNNQTNLKGEYSGNFIFSYGSITTKDKLLYCMMVGSKDEGYLVKKFDSEITYLFLDGENNPILIEKYQTVEYTPKGNWMFGGLFKFDKTPYTKEELIKTEIHIPKNSVKVEYTIDLK